MFNFRVRHLRIWYHPVHTCISRTQLQNVNHDAILEVEKTVISFIDQHLARHHSNSKKRRHISSVRKCVMSFVCNPVGRHMLLVLGYNSVHINILELNELA